MSTLRNEQVETAGIKNSESPLKRGRMNESRNLNSGTVVIADKDTELNH